MEQVILVDIADRQIGTMEKMEVHRKGLLHRAFSVIIFDSKGNMLLQKRATHKYHSPDLWTNACCSHPRPGESVLEGANRRLYEELGLKTKLKNVDSFIYHCEFENGLIEHEFDYILVGVSDDPPELNLEEVSEIKYSSLLSLKNDILVNPERYTVWFRQILEKINLEELQRSL